MTESKFTNYDINSSGGSCAIDKLLLELTEDDLSNMDEFDLRSVGNSLDTYPDYKVKTSKGCRNTASAILSIALIYAPIIFTEEQLGNNNLRELGSGAHTLQTRGDINKPSILHYHHNSNEFTILDCVYGEEKDPRGALCRILSPEEAMVAKNKEEQYLSIIENRLNISNDDCEFALNRGIYSSFCNSSQVINAPASLLVESLSKPFNQGGAAFHNVTFKNNDRKFDLVKRRADIAELTKPMDYNLKSLPAPKEKPSEIYKYIYSNIHPFSSKSLASGGVAFALSVLFSFGSGAFIRRKAEKKVKNFKEQTNFDARLTALENDNQPT